MDAWIKKVESGENTFTQVKISDKKFSKLSQEYNAMIADQQDRVKHIIKISHYRKDANMLLPLTGGRVGGLCRHTKKWKMAKKQLGRTKYTTAPISERGPWEDRFYVREWGSTELFCDKVWPKKKTIEEENEEAYEEVQELYATLNNTTTNKKAQANTPAEFATGRIGSDDDHPYAAKESDIVMVKTSALDLLIATHGLGTGGNGNVGNNNDNNKDGTGFDFPQVSIDKGSEIIAPELELEFELELKSKLDNESTVIPSFNDDDDYEHISMSDINTQLYGTQEVPENNYMQNVIKLKEEKFIKKAQLRRKERLETKNHPITYEIMKTMSCAALCDYLDRKGFQHYTERIFQKGINGADILDVEEFDLNLLGMSFRPHRLKLMTILDELRGSDKTNDRRKLTKTITSKTLTVPLYEIKQDTSHYPLILSPPKLTAAKRAEIVKKEVEEKMKDQIANFNANLAAEEIARAQQRMSGALELYNYSWETLEKIENYLLIEEKLKLKCSGDEINRIKELKMLETKQTQETYCLRQNVRTNLNKENKEIDNKKASARQATMFARRQSQKS
jgi:hypothetical protein